MEGVGGYVKGVCDSKGQLCVWDGTVLTVEMELCILGAALQ